MPPVPSPSSAGAGEARVVAALAALGAWTIVVPYLARPLGLTVDVAASVEFVDHVLPGAIVVAGALWLLARARRAPLAAERVAPLAAGAAFLAGFWVLATHLPLVADAARGLGAWDAAVWHSWAALPVVVLAAWTALRALPR